MSEKTIVFYGTPEHPTLEPLYQYLRNRGLRRVVFIVQEKFPRDIGIELGAGELDPAGRLLPPYEDPVILDDVCAVCLDGYYVDASRLTDLEERDVRYVQTEGWATLIALFGRLARRRDCVVANHVTKRELVASRAAQLAYLATCGLRVPRMLLTSDPAAAREFFERCAGRAIYKPASTPVAQFSQMEAADLERLDAIKLAPVHFEEVPSGELTQCVVVGPRAFTLGDAIPAEILNLSVDACRRLDLQLAEVTMRVGDVPVATGLRTHLSPETLHNAEILEAVSVLLEGGEAE